MKHLEPLHVPTPETPVMTEAEVAGLLNAYRVAGEAAEPGEREWWALARRLTAFALRTASDVARSSRFAGATSRCSSAACTFARGEMGEPKSKAGRRTIGYGPRTADVLEEQWKSSSYRSPESLVFCHPALGTPLDASKVSGYMRKAIAVAGIDRPIRPWHDLRHTALTHDAAAGNPAVYVQARAGHAQGDDDRTPRPRRAGRVPRCRRTGRGAAVRRCDFAGWLRHMLRLHSTEGEAWHSLA